MNSKDSLLPEPTCALLRHAFGCFYDAFSQIDLANRSFNPTLVFHETLLSFRSTVLTHDPTPLYRYRSEILSQEALHVTQIQGPPRRSTPTICLTRHHQRPRLQIQTHRRQPSRKRSSTTKKQQLPSSTTPTPARTRRSHPPAPH